MDDPVDEAVLKGEFGGLHPIGHSDIGNLGEDPWTDEANLGSGFGENNVAEKGKASDPPNRRVRQNTEVKPVRRIVPRMAAAIFAICTSDKIPSCTRAPLELVTITRGSPWTVASSTAR